MIWVDFSIIGLFSIFPLLGLWRGFNRELFALVFWVLALVTGLNFSKGFSLFLQDRVTGLPAQLIVSFIALVMLTLLLGTVIRFILGHAMNQPDMGFFSRPGGMLAGCGHGALCILLLVVLAGMSELTKEPWWHESQFLPPFQAVAVFLRDHLSTGIADFIRYQ